MPDEKEKFFGKKELSGVADALAAGNVKKAWMTMLADLNVCSQKGLVEMFDGSIGAGSVYMPYGGKYQLTETQTYGCQTSGCKGQTVIQ